MKHYCWLEYYDPDTNKHAYSDSIKYYEGSSHSVQPTIHDLAICLISLAVEVNTIRFKHISDQRLSILSTEIIRRTAVEKTHCLKNICQT